MIWAGFSLLHAPAFGLFYGCFIILDILDLLNALEFVTGTFLVLLIGSPFFGYACSRWYVQHHNRNVRHVYCKSCGYDLTGNASGRCPECGKEIATAPVEDNDCQYP